MRWMRDHSVGATATLTTLGASRVAAAALTAWLAVGGSLVAVRAAAAEDQTLRIDLAAADAARSWVFADKPAGRWHRGELAIEGDLLRVSMNGKQLLEARDAKLSKGRIGFYANQGLARVKDIEVVGTASQPQAALEIPPPHHVVVCEDAGAGAYEAFPDVCRLNDGRLMAVFYAGYGHVSLPNERLPKGGRIAYCTSNDEGRTWSDAQTLYDGPDDDRDPSIVQLKNGTLICNFFSLRKLDPPPKSGKKWRGLGTWIVTSDDLGKTWSPPRQISVDHYCSSPIRELSTGRLILGLYAEADGSAHGATIHSDDGGRTWSEPASIDNAGIRLDAETDVIELADGSLFAVQRPAMCSSISKDGGQTWSKSEKMGFPGHCPYLLRTADDIILLGIRLPQTSLRYSTDECRTWSESVLVDDFIGAYPSLVNLRDGSVLVVYYEEGKGSNIRAKRLRASKQGIAWLPVASD